MTGFLDTEMAPAIKLTPQNKGQNVDTESRLNGWDLRYVTEKDKQMAWASDSVNNVGHASRSQKQV